jgi:NAD(P)-dependent dehydrogenase (short-subunit alcohol dehydrogenase family)
MSERQQLPGAPGDAERATRIALVTGGGRGLGRAVALALAEHGWRVAVMARTPEQVEGTAAEVAKMGGSAAALPGDVTREADVTRCFAECSRLLGVPNALVNCAGSGRFGPTIALTLEEWQQHLEVNLTGTFLCCREAMRLMPVGGQIVNILSIAADTPFPGAAAYCAAKAGALALTRVIAAEVRPRLRVTALLPGSIDTPFWEQVPHSFDPADMLRPGDVAVAVRWVLEQPPEIHTDELRLLPPRGIL